MMPQAAKDELRSFWSLPTAEVLAALQSSPNGLAVDAAAERLARIGPNTLGERKRSTTGLPCKMMLILC